VRLDNVSNGSLNNNSLQVVVTFNTDLETEAFVEYWLAGSNEKSTSDIYTGTINHEIVLIGLTGESEYIYRIHLKNKELESTSNEYSFITGELPIHLPEFNLVVNKENAFDGFLMLRKMDDPGAQIIINSKGKIVWYQLSDSVIFRPFSITDNSTYLALKAKDEIVEMNFYGDTTLHLFHNENGFDKKLHHEIFKDENNNIVALTKEEKVFDLLEFGGTSEVPVAGDGILILDTLGNKVWHWNMFDVMDIGPSERMYQTRGDWSHANALSKDNDGNFLISFRNFNQIWKIDATDGHIIWKLGDDGNIELDDRDHFRVQHNVHINPYGSMMIFDNINIVDKRRSSRALAFKIDEIKKSAEKVLEVRLPDSLYSFKQGSVSLIDKDKLLFCSSMSKKLAITDLSGNIIWQVNSNQSFYRAEYIPKFQN